MNFYNEKNNVYYLYFFLKFKLKELSLCLHPNYYLNARVALSVKFELYLINYYFALVLNNLQ